MSDAGQSATGPAKALQTRLSVVLVEPRNPLNIGAAARAMSNFGFEDLRLVRPYDVAFREAVSAVNAERVMQSAQVFDSVADAVGDCRLVVGATGLGHRKPNHPLYSLPQASRLIRKAGNLRIAVLFGSEKFGLSNDDVMVCHWLLRIPTRPEHESMNLAQAVAVCLYELIRRPAAPLPDADEKEQPASSEELERMSGLLEEVLHLSGYKDFGVAKAATGKVHRLVRRMDLRGEDASIWTGMIRQILWRLKNPAGQC